MEGKFSFISYNDRYKSAEIELLNVMAASAINSNKLQFSEGLGKFKQDLSKAIYSSNWLISFLEKAKNNQFNQFKSYFSSRLLRVTKKSEKNKPHVWISAIIRD